MDLQQLHQEVKQSEQHYSAQLQEKDSLISSLQHQQQQAGSEWDLSRQKLLNQLKQLELENMQLTGQVLQLKSEQEQSKHSYTHKLEQIETTVKNTLQGEKDILMQQWHLDTQQALEQQQATLLAQRDQAVKLATAQLQERHS